MNSPDFFQLQIQSFFDVINFLNFDEFFIFKDFVLVLETAFKPLIEKLTYRQGILNWTCVTLGNKNGEKIFVWFQSEKALMLKLFKILKK